MGLTLRRLVLALTLLLGTASCSSEDPQFVTAVGTPSSTSTTQVDVLATVAPVVTIAPTTTPTTVLSRTTTPRAARSRPSPTAAPPTQVPDGPSTSLAPTGSGHEGAWYPASCLGRKMGREEAHACWDPLMHHYWGARYSKAFSVMYCESTGRSDARNGKHIGLFQQAGGSTDPETAIAHAARRQASEGWGPWDYGCV